ncbi:MAG: hypothetical protein IPG69_21290 [Flavobacteriales bacterium]|nr:hypothetical protein [Flavobacteriales bacterium]
MNLQPHIKRTLLQAVMIAAGLTITVAANAQAFVAFEGRLLVAAADMENVHMTVTDGTETMDVSLRANGKFEFFIPVNDQVTLTLDRPGYISKTMLIDTHNAPSKEGADRPHRPRGTRPRTGTPAQRSGALLRQADGQSGVRCRHRRDPDHRPGS